MSAAVGFTGDPDSLSALPPPPDMTGTFRPAGMNADGTMIAGNCMQNGAPGGAPVLWRKADGTTALAMPPHASWIRVVGVCADGTAVVAAMDAPMGVEFVRWESGVAAPQNLGGGGVMAALALSCDGRVVVGSMGSAGAQRVPVTFDVDRGLVEVPHPVNAIRSECVGADRTGARVVVNCLLLTSVDRPFIYSTEEGLLDLWGIPADIPATAGAISASGRYVAGSMGSPPEMIRPFRWSDAQGAAEMGTPWGDSDVFATHISGDGSLIAGMRGPATASLAWVWTQAGGARDLAELLADRGVNTEGWTLESIGAVSRDGTVIAGVGTRYGYRGGWVATLASQRCGAADLTGPGGWPGGDGALTADDVVAFLNAFFTGDSAADVASLGGTVRQDGAITADDVAVFLAAFFAGCP
ncbi:MAG: GC-type dockerin domain-anchored protein [Phycisphaerales bacterium]